MPAPRVFARRIGRLLRIGLGTGAVIAGLALLPAPAFAASDIPGCSELTGKVHVTMSDSTFLADKSALPVLVANALDDDATVTVTISASNPRLAFDQSSLAVTVPAGSQTSVNFPATAVSNGTVRVTASLSGPGGCSLGATAAASVDVQAGWETPIAAAALGVLGVIIVLGVIRTVRRTRRARAVAVDVARDGGDG